MTKVISILTVILSFFTAHFMQIELRINPEKYNLVTPVVADLPERITEPEADDYVQLSEVNMHYRIYGHGDKDMILIHGNGANVTSLSYLAGYFANDYTVYVTESRCHGTSSDPGVIDYELMAKDIYEFGQAMGIEKPIILGHSDGGIVALAVASHYPDFPGAIIPCGANSNPDGFWPYFPFGVWFNNTFVDNDKLNDMMLEEPHFTPEYLARIQCPAYILCGEYDIMKLTDTVYIHENVDGSDMAVVKGADHGSYINETVFVLATEWIAEKGL